LNGKKYKILLTLIVVVFIWTRFLGLGDIYHQDEYRWASIADPFFGNLESPHPPLTEYLYKATGKYLGFDYLRSVPIIFSFLNLLLLYFVVKRLTGKTAVGLIAVGLFTINIYSAIASLQIDIDGAILPFFVLLGFYSYLNLQEDTKSKKYLTLFIISLVGGFLTKLSFVLFLGTLVLHNFKRFLRFLVPIAVLGGLFYLLYALKFEFIIKYAESFTTFNFGFRKYFDLVLKIFKSLVWLSPLLFWPLVSGLFDRAIFKLDFLCSCF